MNVQLDKDTDNVVEGVTVLRIPGNTTKIDFKGADSKVSDYVNLSRGDSVSVNGREVKPDDLVEPGAQLIVAGRASNG